METGAKHFRKRSAILECLRSTHTHPSAEWVFQQLKPQIPDLSLGTVYRNLTLFRQQGLVTSVGTVQGVERFDADTTPHVHFICVCCGRVEDLPDVRVPDSLAEKAARASGGMVSACRLTFDGVCKDCQNHSGIH